MSGCLQETRLFRGLDYNPIAWKIWPSNRGVKSKRTPMLFSKTYIDELFSVKHKNESATT